MASVRVDVHDPNTFTVEPTPSRVVAPVRSLDHVLAKWSGLREIEYQ